MFAELQVRPAPSALLRAIAARPPGCRPTGSIAETILYQALQHVGLGSLRRQPTVKIHGAPVSFHPDDGDPETGLTVEVDGLSSRRSQFAFRSDLNRQNFLIRGLLVLRYPALQILENPLAVARNIAEVRAGLPRRGPLWEQNGVRVTIQDPDLWIIEPISQGDRRR